MSSGGDNGIVLSERLQTTCRCLSLCQGLKACFSYEKLFVAQNVGRFTIESQLH